MIRVVLVRPAQPRNIGAVVRAAANFSAESVRLIDPENWGPDAEREARVASSGGWKHVQVKVHDTLADALCGSEVVIGTSARNRDHATNASLPDELFGRLGILGTIAVMFGAESQGLTKSELDLCHEWIRLPSCEEFASLNLAQAVLLVLYEYALSTKSNKPTRAKLSEPAPREIHEAVLALIASNDTQTAAKIRQLLYRAQPTKEELAALFNVLNGKSK